MINFNQITQWFNGISKLLTDVRPVIKEIEDRTEVKTIDGIQFVDFDRPSVSNIQQLNEILRQNGLEEIDEDLLKSSLIDIDQIVQFMQNDFTEEELARAIEAPVGLDQPEDVTQLDIDLANICDPVDETSEPEFTESEFVAAACDVVAPPAEKPRTIEQVPIIEPVIDTSTETTPLPGVQDSIFSQIVESAKDAPESPLFPKNAPDCIQKMKDLTEGVQRKVKEYTDVKSKIQEIQLDYYYETISNSYYQSFIKGYGEVERLRKELEQYSLAVDEKSRQKQEEIRKKLSKIKEDYAFAATRSDVQEKLESVIWGFSNQFDIDIDSGFLGLFQTDPLVKINKEKLPLSGKVKDIPDAFLGYVDSVDKQDPSSTEEITEGGKKVEKDMEQAFLETVASVQYYSFAFGLNQFLEGDAISSQFQSFADEVLRSQEEVSKKYLDLRRIEEDAQKEIDGISRFITEELSKMDCKSVETPVQEEPGGDINFRNVSKGPTIFEYNWWVKFCKIATLVNLVPVHWPVGLIIPSPAGLIRVPLPIVWIPVFIAPTDKLVAVLLIGQCGILPCPYLFLLHFLPFQLGQFQSNNPYFALAVGGPVDISNHRPLPSNSIPSFNLVFPALNALLDSFRNGVTTDINAILSEVENQLEGVRSSAQGYLLNALRNSDLLIENARNQALQTINAAKQTAQAAIKAAQEEGRMMIEDARRRYTDANDLSEATLAITRGVQGKINEATRIADEAKALANRLIFDAQQEAIGLRERAQQTVNGILENGRSAYNQKVNEIAQLKGQYDEIVKTLRDLIDKISVPAMDIGSLNLSALLLSYTLSLGGLKSLAADISPKAIQFGFPAEISPQFSASLPMFVDELPPWERLSLLNIPFLFFVWKWCKAGKYVGGFFPESLFGPI